MKENKILLATLNARYIHCALGLRYLYANMGELKARTKLMEFMINQRPIDIAETILEQQVTIVGFGCYIWNIGQTAEVIAILKQLEPSITIVLGGPEVSHETERSPAYDKSDYIITGQGDFAFSQLCLDIIDTNPIPQKIIEATAFDPIQLQFPYQYYSDIDIKQRVVYVEASRGCPFKCEFCISALDKTSMPFDIDLFINEMETLYQRGARHFKFVDRTFNLNVNVCEKILEFFLQKPLSDLFLHFELIPDRLAEKLKATIKKFPDGVLQFEVGIQTFNAEVQSTISRKQDHQKTIDNLKFLSEETQVHLHTDLILGLPGETLESFAEGFNMLVSLNPQEIQLGILKRLRGTPIIRHTDKYQMIFNPNPPYNVLSTKAMNRDVIFRMTRFVRYWDMIANSGRFPKTIAGLLSGNSFTNFLNISDWLYQETHQTHKISLPRLIKLIYQYVKADSGLVEALRIDFEKTGIKKSFALTVEDEKEHHKNIQSASSRQSRHSG